MSDIAVFASIEVVLERNGVHKRTIAAVMPDIKEVLTREHACESWETLAEPPR